MLGCSSVGFWCWSIQKVVNYQTFRTAIGGSLIFACCFCFFESLPSGAERTTSKTSDRDEGVVNDPKFQKQLLEIAAS